MTISEAILTALITGGLSLLGVAMTHRRSDQRLYDRLRRQSERSDARLDREIAVIHEMIRELTREVRLHNDFAGRVPVLEEQVRALQRAAARQTGA